ncbi:uncharacterized protein [Arachis hypogaea]|uniref:uncharacterized protein n=1 Tax=Arachis hypogaea TaxID=3818 RepID=UPI000DECE41F|nr:uncharacterized protein LOC112721863 [Arachis hypogaea]
MAEFKECLKDNFVYEGKECRYIRNEAERTSMTCAEEGCPWLIYTSYNSRDCCYQIKTFVNNHTCGRDFGSNLADRKWVTSKLFKILETRVDLTPKEAKVHMVEEYNMQLHDKMIARVLKAAREQVIGKVGEEYGKIQDYLSELLKRNPGSTAMMWAIPQPEGLPLFDRLYISLEALVDSENTETRKWFLTRLKEDLGDVCNEELNFISDQQKVNFVLNFVVGLNQGIAAALIYVIPNANHRNCVLHIWKNFTKKFKDKDSKSMVWRCAKSTTEM